MTKIFLKLTDLNDRPVLVNVDQVKYFEETRSQQTNVNFNGEGSWFTVKESLSDIASRIRNGLKGEAS